MVLSIVGTVALCAGIVVNVVGYVAAFDRNVCSVWLLLAAEACYAVGVAALWL